ncbi:TetR/AcrR family transcriptional regulator [Bradyrhizobium iriomotense]|uniref:TetR family transcriptional regulator n=1 Tax=Bradyrhizobium iriomotense TaxID=441950 RepID=A0ABQ6AUM4_9BRAD|nr:TetR/AcrR family transcriptional regulator [Bradyrhizobium iriomotense]GLR85155.1 TetR family transcriptional regulator [Bradyrhizobium iriomotense]
MPRSAEQTRKRILDGAYTLFRRHGYSRVSMDDIAAKASFTKRTLYHHFKSKDQLLADVLACQQELALQAFKTFGDRLSGSPEAIVEGMFRELAVWADRPRWAGSGFTRLVIELADLPGHPARLIARRHKARLERCLGELLERSGVRRAGELARAIWLLSEGAISLILVHGDQGYSAAAANAAMTLVRSHLDKHQKAVRAAGNGSVNWR